MACTVVTCNMRVLPFEGLNWGVWQRKVHRNCAATSNVKLLGNNLTERVAHDATSQFALRGNIRH